VVKFSEERDGDDLEKLNRGTRWEPTTLPWEPPQREKMATTLPWSPQREKMATTLRAVEPSKEKDGNDIVCAPVEPIFFLFAKNHY
jgi:hypothetical protein